MEQAKTITGKTKSECLFWAMRNGSSYADYTVTTGLDAPVDSKATEFPGRGQIQRPAGTRRRMKGRANAIRIRKMANVQTMVAPVGRSIFSERYTPTADTSVPMVQPMARRVPTLSE